MLMHPKRFLVSASNLHNYRYCLSATLEMTKKKKGLKPAILCDFMGSGKMLKKLYQFVLAFLSFRTKRAWSSSILMMRAKMRNLWGLTLRVNADRHADAS